jgi:heme/copper-type cytochrome/quinol oxidase subunit 2
MTPYPDLMVFWAVCISWSALFLTAVSIYLYLDSRKSRRQAAHFNRFRFLRDFVFVWVLLGLLGLYIVSIDRGSSIVFASGNLVVEALLIAYTVKNRPREGPEIERRERTSESEGRIHAGTPQSP